MCKVRICANFLVLHEKKSKPMRKLKPKTVSINFIKLMFDKIDAYSFSFQFSHQQQRVLIVLKTWLQNGNQTFLVGFVVVKCLKSLLSDYAEEELSLLLPTQYPH